MAWNLERAESLPGVCDRGAGTGDARENDNVGGDNQRHEKGWEQAEWQTREGAQLRGVGKIETDRGADDEHDVDETDDVPNVDEPLPPLVAERKEHDEERAERNDAVTDTTGDGERVGQLAARVEQQKINADEARDMDEHEASKIEAIDPVAERSQPEVAEQKERREADEDSLGGKRWQPLQHVLLAGEDGGGEPAPEDEPDDDGNRHAFSQNGRCGLGEPRLPLLRSQ